MLLPFSSDLSNPADRRPVLSYSVSEQLLSVLFNMDFRQAKAVAAEYI
jgi:hypothetical protein